jgi:pimeloyl-ACP methyl ester carboxylesterase
VTDYARVVPAVLDTLGIERASVLGHHTGALVATEAAIHFPERVTALIVNGPLVVEDEDYRTFMSGLYLRERDFAARAEAAHMVELFAIRNRLAHGAISPARLSDYVVQSLSGRGIYWHGHHAAYTYRLGDALPTVRQPVLILANTGDVIYPHVERVRAIRPDVAFAVLEGGGIDIVDEQPEAWADAVAGFLRDISGEAL